MKTIFPPTSCDRNHAILIRKWVITKYYSPPTCCVASTGSRNNFHVFSNVVQFRIDFQTYSVIKVGGWRSNMCLLSFAPDLKPKRSNCQTTQTNRLSPWIWFIDPLFIDRHSLRNVFSNTNLMDNALLKSHYQRISPPIVTFPPNCSFSFISTYDEYTSLHFSRN